MQINLLNNQQKNDSAVQNIGAVHKIHPCIRLAEGMDDVVFSPGASGVCALELDELHQVEDGAFSYLVLVNDQAVFQRTMEPMSNSICPCLVKLYLEENDYVAIRMVPSSSHHHTTC